MNRSEEILSDALVRLIDAILSVRLSLVWWLMKKEFGEPVARDFVRLALSRRPYMRRLVWTELQRLPGQELIQLMRILLPHRSRRKFLQQIKKEIRRALNHTFFQQLEDELQSSMAQLAAQYGGDQKPMDERLYPELHCDLNTLYAEPWRAKKAFPMEILKSPREQKRLQDELGYEPDNYARQLNSIIWQLCNNPFSFELPPPRSNDLLFQVVEQKPSEDISGRQVARALILLFKALGDEKKARTLFEHHMARVLRCQFNLSRNRNVASFSEIEGRQSVNRGQAGADSDEEPWEPEDPLSLCGYEDVEFRLEYEALYNRLPPKQKVALNVYLESFDTGESIETICARKQLSTVAVRNNFQAIKHKIVVGKIKM